jgi:zinc and cadmium transporter
MSTLTLVLASGVAMSALALVGAVTIGLPEATLARVTPALVGLAAGSLLGGVCFHMLPEAVARLGNGLGLYLWLVGGFVSVFALEQFLHWHHCHRTISQHRPLGYLILLADGLHNLIGGLAVGAAIIVDHRVGLITWAVAAAHEVPQELGDFGLLLHSGWDRRSALVFNLLSAMTFLLGGVVAYVASGAVEVAVLLPFAAGNFLYIAASDLVPQLTSQPRAREKLLHSLAFLGGLGLLLAVAVLAGA